MPRAVLYALLTVAFLTSLPRAWRDRIYRPVAWLLGLDLASNITQNRIHDLVLVGSRAVGEHYTGAAAAWFAADRALFISYPLGVLAVMWWALWPPGRRGRFPAAPLALWLAISVAMALEYPGAPPDAPTGLFLVAQLVTAAGWLGLATAWAFTARRIGLLAGAALALGAGEAAMLAGPYLLGDSVRDWATIDRSRGAAWVALTVLQLTAWVRARR